MVAPSAFLLVVVFVAGAAIAAQAGINANLARALGSPVLAALASFVIGTLLLALLAVAMRTPLPAAEVVRAAPWWVWTGGLLGAFFIFTAVVAAPRVGAASFLALVIAGQLSASLVLDHFGLLGFAERAATPLRILGAGLLAIGALMVRAF